MTPRMLPSSTDFIRRATEVASHFGFRSLRELGGDKRCRDCKKVERPRIAATDRRLDSLHGILTGGISAYFEHNLQALDGPVLFYTIEQVPRSGEVALTLQVLGIEKSIAEALLIQTMRSLLSDIGYESHSVRINSLGDKDSMNRYTRELTNFMKKNMEFMPGSARELMKEHVLTALMHLVEREHELGVRGPSPLEYLSDPSRRHFREIIEYLDMSATQYEIDTRLLGHHHCYSQTMFAIDIRNEDGALLEYSPILARGGRYDEFVRRMTKKEVPAVGAVVVLRERKVPTRVPRTQKRKTPSLFVIQLGFGPKIKSLLLMDQLKQARINAYQALASDSLSTQLRQAEAYNVPYSLILGQKEFVDNTIIVRNMRDSSQESIPADAIISHLRRTIRR